MSSLKNSIICLIITVIVLISSLMSVFVFIKSKELYLIEKNEIITKNYQLKKEIGINKQEIKNDINDSFIINYPSIDKNEVDTIINDKINNIKTNIESSIINYESYYAPEGLISLAIITFNYDNDKLKSSNVDNYIIDYKTKKDVKDSYLFIGDYKNIVTDYLKKYLENNYQNQLLKTYDEYVNNNANYKYIISNEDLIIYFNVNEITNDFMKVKIPLSNFKEVLNINTEKKYDDINNIKKEDNFYKDLNKIQYIKSITNYYKEDDKSSELLTTLIRGTKVNTISESNLWSKVLYEDKEGYILTELLSDEIVIVESMNPKDEIVYLKQDANVFNLKDKSSKINGILKKDSSIKRIGISSDGWSEVIYNNEAGFVFTSELTLTKPPTTTTTKKKVTIKQEDKESYKASGSTDVPVKNRKIDTSKPMVALTFDDGPNGSSTVRILNILEKNHAVATFFDLGRMMKANPSVAKREESLGCEVETHSYSHPNLNKLSNSEIKSEINKAINAYEAVLGHKPYLIRAPYGNSNSRVRSVINMPFIHWSIDTLDWKSRNKNAILNEINKYSNLDGKIILMHSIHSATADAVETLVPKLQKEGYQLVTIAELVKYKGYNLKNGTIYYNFK